MITFENLDELKNFLQHDKGQKTFVPMRFINVDSLSDWFEMKNFFGTLTTDFIFLSSYCSSDDTFPNMRRLRQDVQKVNRNICILPLSEFLRVNPDQAAKEINLFLNLHKGGVYSFRVYFLMYRLKSFFLTLKITDPRKKDCLLSLSSDVVDDYSLTIIQNSIHLKAFGESVDGFKNYLQCWEKSPNASLTLYTENAVHLQDKTFFDKVKVIANAFDLLHHHYKLPTEFKRNFGCEENWQRLSNLVATSGSFERAFCKEFNIESFSTITFKNFRRLENFHQWLLWLRCILQDSGYLERCAKSSNSTEEFTAQIYNLIFSFVGEKIFDELCEERREILSLMKILPPENFTEKVQLSDKQTALKVLTDNSQTELSMIFETLQRFRFNELDAVCKILQQTFPTLANYLSESAEGFTMEQVKYFRCYRWLKTINKLTSDFNHSIKELAKNAGRNIYALKSRNEIVSEEYSDTAAIFFVDGLGAEYVNFLIEDFSSIGENFSIKYQVGRCNLPSVTEINKDFLKGRNVACEILEFDSLKHKNFTYPENILNELKFLSTLKEKILRALDVYEKIILCADHGTSRLAVLARQTKFDTVFPAEGRTVYNNGRFADSLTNDIKTFPNAIEYDEKIIFADYSRFTQKGTPGIEIHGGASLEETLVPVITIERRKTISDLKTQSSYTLQKVKRGIEDNKNFNI